MRYCLKQPTAKNKTEQENKKEQTIMTYERRNKGTCSVMTKVELNPDHTIESVEVLGGCNGNLKGICQLLKGMKAEDAIERMKGTLCGSKPAARTRSPLRWKKPYRSCKP